MENISEKRRKFAELGTNRVNKAINDIRLIGNLSNKANYDYNDDDVRQIIKALRSSDKYLTDEDIKAAAIVLVIVKKTTFK